MRINNLTSHQILPILLIKNIHLTTSTMPSEANINFIDNDREYKLTSLKQIHHEILMLYVLGYNQTEIAERLGKSKAMVNYTVNSPIAQKKLQMMRRERDLRAIDLPEEIRKTAPIAFQEMQRMLVDPNTNEVNRRQIAQDILDRAGFGDRAEKDDDTLTTEAINEVKDIAKKKGYLREVEEAEVVNETPNIDEEE